MTFNVSTSSFHGPAHIGRYSDVTGKVFDWDIMRLLLRYLIPYRLEMAESMMWMLISSGLALLTPYLTKQEIDIYITQGNYRGVAVMR